MRCALELLCELRPFRTSISQLQRSTAAAGYSSSTGPIIISVILTCELHHGNRYRGSADAVRNNLDNITEVFDGEPVDDLLILSGQALYSMVRLPV